MINVDKQVSYKQCLQDIKEIFNYLEDDTSKELFLMYLNKNIQRKKTTINHMKDHLSTKLKNDLDKYNNSVYDVCFNKDETVILYGAGAGGAALFYDPFINLKDNVKQIVFCDKNASNIEYWWNEYDNISIITPSELFDKYKDCKIVITSFKYYEEIYDSLIDNKIPNQNISFHIMIDFYNQYFDEVIKFDENEVFIDAGAYDGETSLIFAEKCPNYKKICMFELDKENFDNTKNNISTKINNVEMFNIGLWDKKDTLKFNIGKAGSKINDLGTNIVDVNSIDNIFNNEKVTFIKMDIEGAELNALKGASETIKKYKPKLAICIYHKPEDIIEIPAYIKSLVPEYKLYIRQYSNSHIETVLYAVL